MFKSNRSGRSIIAIALYTGICLSAGAFVGAWVVLSSHGSLPERLVADVGQVQALMATPRGVTKPDELYQRVQSDFERRFVEAAVAIKGTDDANRDRFARIAQWSLEQNIFSGQGMTSRRAGEVATCMQGAEKEAIHSCIQEALSIQ